MMKKVNKELEIERLQKQIDYWKKQHSLHGGDYRFYEYKREKIQWYEDQIEELKKK